MILSYTKQEVIWKSTSMRKIKKFFMGSLGWSYLFVSMDNSFCEIEILNRSISHITTWLNIRELIDMSHEIDVNKLHYVFNTYALYEKERHALIYVWASFIHSSTPPWFTWTTLLWYFLGSQENKFLCIMGLSKEPSSLY